MADRGDTALIKNGPNTPCPPDKHEKTPQLHPFTNENFSGTLFCTTFFAFFQVPLEGGGGFLAQILFSF